MTRDDQLVLFSESFIRSWWTKLGTTAALTAISAIAAIQNAPKVLDLFTINVAEIKDPHGNPVDMAKALVALFVLPFLLVVQSGLFLLWKVYIGTYVKYSWRERIPTAFAKEVGDVRVDASGGGLYQSLIILIFVAIPQYALWHCLNVVFEGRVCDRSVLGSASGCKGLVDQGTWANHLFHFVPFWKLTNDIRFPAPNGVVFAPFWEPWILLILVVVNSGFLIWLLLQVFGQLPTDITKKKSARARN